MLTAVVEKKITTIHIVYVDMVSLYFLLGIVCPPNMLVSFFVTYTDNVQIIIFFFKNAEVFFFTEFRLPTDADESVAYYLSPIVEIKYSTLCKTCSLICYDFSFRYALKPFMHR